MAHEEVTVNCNYCNNPLKVFASDIERIVRCNVCGKFNKIAGKEQRRIEMACPECQTQLSISPQLRGQVYRCRSCGKEIQLLPPAKIDILEIEFLEQIEQGGENYEILISLGNNGTRAHVEYVQFAFENEGDVANYYNVIEDESNPLQVSCGEAIQLRYTFDVAMNAPAGVTNVYLVVSAKDELDGAELKTEATFQWEVLQQRVFVMQTEHQYHEVAGAPFAIQLWAFLQSKEVDTEYEGVHTIHFESNATESPLGVPCSVPQSLSIEFQEGVGVTNQEFLFYNSAETPQIDAFEDIVGGPKGSSDPIFVHPGAFYQFAVFIEPRQINGCAFRGQNIVQAIDQYGNLFKDFAQDVWINPASGMGQISIGGEMSNHVPASAFHQGIVDLTSLHLVYSIDHPERFPVAESFIVSYGEREGHSNPVQVEDNPIKISIAGIESQEIVEQGQPFSFSIIVKNHCEKPLRLEHEKNIFQFLVNTEPVDEYYSIEPHENEEILPPFSETRITFLVRASKFAPLGITWVDFNLFALEPDSEIYAKNKGVFQWNTEPSGRSFQIVSPDPLEVEAGKAFSIELAVYLGNEIDRKYEGKRVLVFESNASPSPNNIEPDIPERMEVFFKEGIGKTSAAFVFTNATQENQNLKIQDLSPGGARSDFISFSVNPSMLDYFYVFMQEELTNGECFDETNQIMAMDSYGNLITDFEKPVFFSSVNPKGQIHIDGKPENTIPASAFSDGILSLDELAISYCSDLQTKLPTREEFYFMCDSKKGKSKPISILPRAAKIVIVSCSAPDEIEQGGEDYPIYLGLENGGDRPASISSVLFAFSQEGKADVSSHYTVLPSPANSKNLIPGVPLQLTYTTKVGPKAPIGVINVEVKVTGIDIEGSYPLQAKTSFQWTIEVKGRSFHAHTEHQNVETAGQRFALKISCTLENQSKDISFSGQKLLGFTSNASHASGGTPAIPDKLMVNFERGEASTPPEFMLVNASENPLIQIRELNGTTQGQTMPIQVKPGPVSHFKLNVYPEIRVGEMLQGTNNLVATDAMGNVKKDFAEDVNIAFQGLHAWFVHENGQRATSLSGKWFMDGMMDLTQRRLVLSSAPEQKLPAQAHLTISYGNLQAQSNPLKVLPRPVTATLDKIDTMSRAIQEQSTPIRIKLTNQGENPVKIKNIDFRFMAGEKVYGDYKIEEGESNPTQIAGTTSLTYYLVLSSRIQPGTIQGKVIINLIDPLSQMGFDVQGHFSIKLEPNGRTFVVETENRQKESAGTPFALRISAMLNEKQDSSYEGDYPLLFSSDAQKSPSGKSASIPELLTVNFRKGQATTLREFVLFGAQDSPQIKVEENIDGGASGTTPGIEVKAGELQKFEVVLQNPQRNATPFGGSNLITAIDLFGNVKVNFKEDVHVHGESRRGDISISASGLLNVIPGNLFKAGIVDLGEAGFTYKVSEPERLPCNERFMVSYGEKEGISNDVTIQPRPSEIAISEISFPESVFQGEKTVGLAFKVRNNGDSNLSIVDIKVRFDMGEDISSQFILTPNINNPSVLQCSMVGTFNYSIDVADNATVDTVNLGIFVQCADAISQAYIEAEEEFSFQLHEKLRELRIVTEHDNAETVGTPFCVKITVFKDGEVDTNYEGPHEIRFTTTAQSAGGYKPTYPESEVIEFSKGQGKSKSSFNLSNSAEKPIIKAEEVEKAQGKSKEINVWAGPMQSLKIIFDKPDQGGYTLKPLDRFDNIIQQAYVLDEDIRGGAILTGSGGAFYEILEIVGHGAMGKVYKGRRINDGLSVAIKTTLFNALSDISRFILEGLMLIRFNHPNIVKGYDLRQICVSEGNKAQSKFFMVMEYLPGQSVKDTLDSSKTGVLSVPYATKIILHTARALSYMWEHQTIHRDIKPENIQLTEDGRIKLIDLGIARAESGEVDIYLTQKDTIIGSYPYISPERLKGGGTIDFRSDIYSLGATYYHLLTGMPPYLDTYKGGGGKDLLEYLIRIRTKRMPTPPNKLVENIPENISDAIMTMLNIKSNKRNETAEELLSVLDKAYEEVK